MKAKVKPHKLLSLLLALVMVVGMLPMGQVAYAYSEGKIAGTTGSGTEADPIIVDTFAELKAALELNEDLYITVNSFETTSAGYTGIYGSEDGSKDYTHGGYAIHSYGKKVLTVNTTIDVRPLSVNEGLYGFINVLGTLEINGTGTIACGFNSAKANAVLDVMYPGVLIVNDGITIKGGYGMGNEYHGIAVRNYSGTVTINGGAFWGNSGTADGSTSAFFQAKSGGNSTIKGGTFNVTKNDSTDSFGLSADNNKVTLSGGTYQGIKVASEITIANLLAAADYYYCHVDSNGTFDGTSVTETTQVLTVKTKRIDAVDVNITAPVAGAQPQPASSNTENTKVLSTEWSLDGTRISETDTFEAGKTYKARVSVYPKNDYFFADALTVTINGSAAVTDFRRSGSAIIFEVEFTTGNTITVTDGKATVDGVEVNQAAEGTTVTLTANAAPDDKVFDKWVVENGSITLADASSATTTFVMPAGAVSVKATYVNVIETANCTITVPIGGATPDFNPVSSDSSKYTVKLDYWYLNESPYPHLGSTDVFAAGKEYALRVIFTANEGYSFGDKTVFTINGEATLPYGIVGYREIEFTAPVGYDITVTGGKATVGAGTEITKAAEGTTVTLTANDAPAGQVFDKWVVENGSITLADASSATTTFVMPAGAVSVKATYVNVIETANCTITVPIGGATPDFNPVSSDSSKYTVKLDYWYLNESPYPHLGSTDVFAAGKEYALRVIFTANEGYSFGDKTVFTINGEATLPYGIVGYREIEFTAAAASTEYSITVTDGKATVGAGTEISKAAEGTTVTLTANAAPTDKVFDKWEVVSGSITLADATSETTTFTMPAGAVSVKATYKDKPVTTYTVSFDANGGTGSMADATGVSGDYVLPVCGFTAPNGKQFKAWSVGGVEKAAGDTITVNANTTVTAIWENIPVTYYTVTFDSNGGSAVTAQSIEAGQKATKPADPTKDGYDFKGWTLNGSAYDFNTAVNGNITLVATWEQQQVVPTTYTVSFAANGGTGTMADVTGISGEYTLPENGFTAPDGKQFKAWSVGGVEKAVGDKITVTADTTVTAVWEDIPAGHTCDIKPVAKVEPSCTEAGKEAYYKCEGCGKFYEDALGTKEITDLAAWGNLAKLGHTESDWKSDKDNHWKECTVAGCGVIIENSKAAHADANNDGKCDTCEYNVGIPTTPGGDKPNDNPQTGDNSMMGLWIALLFVSGFGVVTTTVYTKKRKSVK